MMRPRAPARTGAFIVAGHQPNTQERRLQKLDPGLEQSCAYAAAGHRLTPEASWNVLVPLPVRDCIGVQAGCLRKPRLGPAKQAASCADLSASDDHA
jgi:hypothetical protein